MQIPVDVIESLKTVAAARGFTAYQTLLRSYISDGLRRDEEEFDQQATSKPDQGKNRLVQRKGKISKSADIEF